MTTINDRKTPVPLAVPFDDVAEYFLPTILMETDYFPTHQNSSVVRQAFGMQLFDPATLTLDGEYRFGFNTQEKVDEIKGAGNHYTAPYWEYDPRVVHRWNVDPRANPAMSPYAILGGNPIMYTDWLGDSILAVFDKSANTLEVMDMDHFDPSKPFERVGYQDYIVGGVYDDDGNIVKNQILVIEGVFTGGQSDSRGNITYGNTDVQLPIPKTIFEILYHDDEGWYRLDPKDSSPRNDIYDNPYVLNASGVMRRHFRLHIGGLSHGCITGNIYNEESVKGFNTLEQILKQTSTSRVRDHRGRLGWSLLDILLNMEKLLLDKNKHLVFINIYVLIIISCLLLSCNPRKCLKNLSLSDQFILNIADYEKYCILYNQSLLKDEKSFNEFLNLNFYDGLFYEHGYVITTIVDSIGQEILTHWIQNSKLDSVKLKLYLMGGHDLRPKKSKFVEHRYPLIFKN